MPESNPAEAAQPGQPADREASSDKTKKPTHADIQSLQESAEIAGKIVLLSRGGCGFLEKVKWVQRRGGIALIVGDDERGGPLIVMYARGDTSNVTIPALFTSHTTAHILSSLIPPDFTEDSSADGARGGGDPETTSKGNTGRKAKDNAKAAGPTFTSDKGVPTDGGTTRPSIVPATHSGSTISSGRATQRSWLGSLLSSLGMGGDRGYPWHLVEDSRRPPSSGNIDWVLLEDWDEGEPAETSNKGHVAGSNKPGTSGKVSAKSKLSVSDQSPDDGFVIGVQDWRDPDLVAPEPIGTGKARQRRKNQPSLAKLHFTRASPLRRMSQTGSCQL